MSKGKSTGRPVLIVVASVLLSAAAAWAGEPVTFSKDVAPILQRNCHECHRPGEAVPMSLLTYEDARPWAKSIKRMVATREMPPWHPDPGVGTWKNDRRLSDDEVATIVAWVNGGALEGDPADLPLPLDFTAGWKIGEPDRIFTMLREEVLPPELEDEYRYVVIPTTFQQDRWIAAAEVRPGNVEVVHHVITFTAKLEDLAQNGAEGAIGGMLGGYAPGMQPFVMPEGYAMHLPAGSAIVLQMHYHKESGQEARDRTVVGVKFADGPVKKAMRIGTVGTEDFLIPAGAENHAISASRTYGKDVTLWEIMPHMHLRGKDMRVWLEDAKGEHTDVLWVPRYDFNWQVFYGFAEPLQVPAGSTVHALAHYDNSAQNPSNPDPTAEVTFGLPTTAEMMFAFYTYTVDDEELDVTDPGPAAEATGGGR
jgi:hypothetical protein